MSWVILVHCMTYNGYIQLTLCTRRESILAKGINPRTENSGPPSLKVGTMRPSVSSRKIFFWLKIFKAELRNIYENLRLPHLTEKNGYLERPGYDSQDSENLDWSSKVKNEHNNAVKQKRKANGMNWLNTIFICGQEWRNRYKLHQRSHL